jgi:hypothetical protein
VSKCEARGKIEGSMEKAIDVVKKMLLDNGPIENIIKYTKLIQKGIMKLES